MFITGTIIAGCIYTFGKELHEKHSKKTQQLSRHLRSNSQEEEEAPKLIDSFISSIRQDKREQQLQQFGSIEKSEEEKAIDRDLVLSAGLMGFTLMSYVVYPPLLILAIPPAIYSALPFTKRAWKALTEERKIVLEVMDLVNFAGTLLTGYIASAFFDSTLYFTNRKILLKTEDHSLRQMYQIMEDLPATVWLVKGSVEIEIPLDSVEVGNVLSVYAGQTIPVDGVIIDGAAMIDERMLTGESQPIDKGIGATCFASTLLVEGKVHIRAEKVGKAMVVYQIGDALNHSLDYRDEMVAEGQKRADKTTLPLLAFAGAALPFVGPVGSVALLNSNYGFNLRMISPMIVLNYLSIAAQEGLLIKDGRVLELLHKVDTIVFDKTGTLTLNLPNVEKIHLLNQFSENELLTFAAAAEYRQSHPIAQAILEEAEKRSLPLPDVVHTKIEIGYGIYAKADENEIHIGSARFMAINDISISENIKDITEKAQEHGNSMVCVAVNGVLEGVIELCPTIRPEAKQVVSFFQNRGIECIIISGDHHSPTRRLAWELGIETYHAEVLPAEKASLVDLLRKEKKTVCFVGDGINDSIALKKADVSISLNGATSIATDTAQIILMDEALRQLPLLFEIGKQYHASMKSNFYTAVTISGLVTGGVFFFHFGILAAIIANQISMTAGMGISIHPLIAYQEAVRKKRKAEIKKHIDEHKTSSKEALPTLVKPKLLLNGKPKYPVIE